MPSDLQNIGLRLPADLLARIDGLKGSRPGWKTRTDIMIALLEVGLSAGIAAEQGAGENVWDAIGDLRDRLASVEAMLRSAPIAAAAPPPPQPAPTAPKQRGGLTEEERDAIAAAKRPTERTTAAAPPAAAATSAPAAVEPPPPPDKPPGKGLSQEDALKSAGYKGSPPNAKRALRPKGSTPQQWLEDRGWSQVKGRWYPPGG